MKCKRIVQALICMISLVLSTSDLTAKEINDFTSFSGKIKKNKPVGEGTLTVKSSTGPSVIITGVFSTLPDGRTQAVGSLEAKQLNRKILKGTYFFDAQNIRDISIEKGYIFEENGIVIEENYNDRLSAGQVIGQSEREEKITLTPTHTLTAPSVWTPMYLEFPRIQFNTDIKITGWGFLGSLGYFTFESKENSENIKYIRDGSKFIPVEAQYGDSWIKFSNEDPNKLISFYKKDGNRSLTGEFLGKKDYDDPNVFKGTFDNEGSIVEGEYILPISGEKAGFKPRYVEDLNRIPMNPEFITVTTKKGVKNHKKITLEEGGTLVNHFTPEELLDVDSLTIVGIIYRADIKLINALTNLEYLDISKTFITYSPEDKRKRKEEEAFAKAFLNLMNAENERQASTNNITQEQYENNKLFLKILEESKEVDPKSDPCFVPAINKLPALRTVILPVQATRIENEAFMLCPNLRTVVFPEYLESIGSGCFLGCEKLNNLKFPNTLKKINDEVIRDLPKKYYRFGTFGGCSSLTNFDLSKCNFEDRKYWLSFPGCLALKKVAFPANTVNATFRITENLVYDLYLPPTLKELFVGFLTGGENVENGSVIVHFSSIEPPKFNLAGEDNIRKDPANKTPICSKIYIPKGTKMAYYLEYGDKFEYIEE